MCRLLGVAINDAGQAVGQVDGRPVLWRDGQPTYLADPAMRGDARKINRSGEVVGVISGGGLSPGEHVFTWSRGRLTIPGLPPNAAPDTGFELIGIDERGRVAISYYALLDGEYTSALARASRRSTH